MVYPKLVYTKSCLVVGSERVDDDGDGECEDEDARDGGEAPDELAEVRPEDHRHGNLATLYRVTHQVVR